MDEVGESVNSGLEYWTGTTFDPLMCLHAPDLSDDRWMSKRTITSEHQDFKLQAN